MRIQINLASRPFVELGSVYKRLRIAMIALAVVAVALAVVLHIESAKAEASQAELAKLKNRTSDLQRERSRNEARMKQPQNAAALDRSRFLNDLFTRKGFSWTAVMMDLENVLPAGVQVSSIEPQITTDGDIRIRLRVMGDRDKAVELIRNLEHAKRFTGSRLASESMQTSGNQGSFQQVAAGGNVEFDIISGYNPLAPKVAAPKEVKPIEPKQSPAPKPITPRPRPTVSVQKTAQKGAGAR